MYTTHASGGVVAEGFTPRNCNGICIAQPATQQKSCKNFIIVCPTDCSNDPSIRPSTT